jgi:hypothetical protein
MVALGCCALGAGPVAAQVEHYAMLGIIGTERVGANLAIEDHKRFVEGHYFTAAERVDRPLQGEVVGENVTLTQSDGGRFTLHFETTDASAARPLDFYTSTALVGEFVRGDVRWPVRLGFDNVGGAQGAERYQDVTSASAEQFEAMVARFLDAVQAGHAGEAARAVDYPLRVNGARPMVLRNRAQFVACWRVIFSPCYRAQLAQGVPHEMFVRNGAAMVANGAAWFGAKGAKVLNVGSCRARP